MDSDDEKLTVIQQIDTARDCLDRAGEALQADSIELKYVIELLDRGYDVMQGVAADPHWDQHADKVIRAAMVVRLLTDVSQSIDRHRRLAQATFGLPRTPSDTPSCSSAVSDNAPAAAPAPAPAPNQELIEALRRQVSPSMGLSTVAGMAQAKQLLTEAVVFPMRYRHLFTGARRPWRSVLLYGPPGTGKTKLALAVAAEVDAELYAISPADLLSHWFGKTEQNIRVLFEQLRSRARTHRVIVFLDEVDGLCRRRTDEEAESTRRMKTELLTQLQGDTPTPPPTPTPASSATAGQLFFVCATNCPWEIDGAFLRRFQQRIFIGLPDRTSRREIIHTLASGANPGSVLNLPDSEWQRLLDRTEGFSGSDLADLVKNALYQPVRDLTSATYWVPVLAGMWVPCASNTIGAVREDLSSFPPEMVCARNVTIQDFYNVMENARRTVCQEDLQRYEQFTNQFGQWG